MNFEAPRRELAMRTLVLDVTGMSCQNCADQLTRQLQATEGVESVSVDLGTHTAKVRHDDQVCRPSELISAVRRAGYQVSSFYPEA